MKKFKTVQSQFGFSLVGILVGVALLGILTAGMMQVFSNMALNQNYSKFRTQVDNFGEELRTNLGDKTICTATFAGIQMNPVVPLNFTAIKDGTGKSIYAVNSTYGDNSFVLSAIGLKTLTDGTLWYVEDNAATGTGRMTVSITYKAAGPQSGPKESFRTYVMQVHRDLATNKLIDCTALGKSVSDGIWKYNGSDIYFSGGNVGIGTTAPNTILTLSGPQASPPLWAQLYLKPSGADQDMAMTIESNHLGTTQDWFVGSGFNGGDPKSNFFRIVDLTHANADRIDINPNGDIYLGGTQTGDTASGNMVILNSGNVGIGTSSPSYLLHVANSTAAVIAADTGSTSKQAQIKFSRGGSSNFDSYVGPSAINNFDIWTNESIPIVFYTGSPVAERMRIMPGTGNVGIGTATPGDNTKLRVNGQIATSSASISSGAVDFSLGNVVTTTFGCGAPITFANLRDGGSYTLVVTSTGTTMCSFSTAVTGDDVGTVAYRFSPANAVRTTSSHTLYSLLRVGGIVYVSWITGM